MSDQAAPDPPAYHSTIVRWSATGVCIVLVVLAMLLVRFVPMQLWRRSLGRVSEAGHTNRSSPALGLRRIAAHVERASDRLPLSPKCLPRAIVVQWLAKALGHSTALTIAIAKQRQQSDCWHAWVECDGRIVIGHCDSDAYTAILSLSGKGRTISGSRAVPTR